MTSAIILGDSTHNTLSVVRSLGQARVPFILLLSGEHDTCNVARSKYLRHNKLIRIGQTDDALPILRSMTLTEAAKIICTYDEAAELVDRNEEELSSKFITPCRGKRIGQLFNKDAQCALARSCGLTVPESRLFHRGDDIDDLSLPYPVIIKPLYSTKGEKSDIHICHSKQELVDALNTASACNDFILQEFIDKEYELNCVGISTDAGIIIPGAIHKLRHYPNIVGTCSYGIYDLAQTLNINLDGIKEFLDTANYHGPFSIEFLHCKGKNYFMEVNFRNDGLAYMATAAGANLHAKYINESYPIDFSKTKSIYMMNYSIDYLHVKEGRISKSRWWRDFLRTRCFINASLSDPMPTLAYYLKKLPGLRHLSRISFIG